jgi:predicted CXXCH cytochrome family protein
LAWGALVIGLLSGTTADSDTLTGSKHDLTSLNRRAGVEAMGGLAFNDYRDPCVYCHLPDNADVTALVGAGAQIKDWNRFLPDTDYQLYDSDSLSSRPKGLGPESLVCLSCHDGSMAVDMVVSKPAGWRPDEEAPLHMRMAKGGGMDRCTQCHDGITAHKMDNVIIGSDLRDDHPVGMKYPGTFDNPDYFRPAGGGRFSNGVRLFDGRVECASCHNVHDPQISPFMRVEQKKLCLTCHNK